jgi:UDP-N-acetylglucosamine--N-acetylmuramyl-(pentapeptide) pyrophosphoryl-undecaprenol N-acetylglucosamine transferase
MAAAPQAPLVAIACGGTGGHLFPGLAVGESLAARGCDVRLLVSPKEVDQQAVKSAVGMSVATLPAVACERGRWVAFFHGLLDSYRQARGIFRARPPAAVLAMGGFTSVAPVLAGRHFRAARFLHEANAVPGRANRWLAHFVDKAFVYFPEAAGRLWLPNVRITGMPVRPQFQPLDAESCRAALGLHPHRPVLLITGGSQGAHGINQAVLAALPALVGAEPMLQYIHLTGPRDADPVRAAYAAAGCRALVQPFLTEMELAFGAATLAVSRAGASSLAEQAAVRVPAILIPFPAAADNHQLYNARAFVATGAARLLTEAEATPPKLLWEIRHLLNDEPLRQALRVALRRWYARDAADAVAEFILRALPARPAAPASDRKPAIAPTAVKAAAKIIPP